MKDIIREYLSGHKDEMLAMLERLVRINSYSGNKAGVDAVVSELEKIFAELGMTTRREAQSEVGDNLVAENAARLAGGRGVMLCGHMDTVFPQEMGFDCFELDGNKLHGPGTCDMKAGIVGGIFALKALAEAGMLDDMPVCFVCNSDEEIGSPHSRELVMEEARKSDFCFVMEGSGFDGEIVTGRKGRRVFKLSVTGKAAHAGKYFSPKASAILELSRMVVELEKLNNVETGTSLNVGVIEGGVGPNTVSAHAWAKAECRYVNLDAGDEAWSTIGSIAAMPQNPEVKAQVEVLMQRPPMVTNDAIMGLYDLVKATGDELNIPVQGVFRGGGSDANIVSLVGTPVLDGMGPAGDLCHTLDEYLHIDSMIERTILAAVSMRRAFEHYRK